MIEFDSVEEYIQHLIELKVQDNIDKQFALDAEIDFLEVDIDSDCNSSDYSFDYRIARKSDNDVIQLGYN